MKTTAVSKAKQVKAARAQVRFWTAKRREARRIELGAMRRYHAAASARRASRTPETAELFLDSLGGYNVARSIRMERANEERNARVRLGKLFA
jgi:hypothetical protein